MAEVASAFVSLMPSAKGFGRSTERQIGPQMTGVAKRTGSRFGKVFATATMSPLRAIGAAAIGLFAVAKVKQFFQGAIAEAREAQKVSAITAQVIKSTGGAANISAAQVEKLAGSISGLTGIDDEAIQSGANLLLTFKNVRNEAGRGNDIFNQTTRIMTDMSVAMGTDAKGSAIQLGKALNDPVKGITALTRVGVTFTDQQKEQIAKLVESGNVLGAQKIILKELKSEFGGTAAAAATAGDRFKVAFANLQESVGTALLPLLDRLLLKGVQVIGFLQTDVPKAFATAQAATAPFTLAIRAFVEDHLPAFKTALAGLSGSVLTSLIALMGSGLVAALGVVVGALTSPIALIGALAGAFLYAYRTSDAFRLKVNEIAAWTQTNLVPALVQIGTVLRDDVGPAILSFGQWLFGIAYPAAIKFWMTIGQKLQPALVQMVATFKADVLPSLQLLGQRFKEASPTIGKLTLLVIRLEAAYALMAASVLGKVLPPLIRLTGFMASGHLRAINLVLIGIGKWISLNAQIGGALGKAGAAVGKFAQVVREKLGSAIDYAKTVPGLLVAALRTGVALMIGVGKDLLQGLLNGLKAKGGEVLSYVRGLASDVVGVVAGVLKIHSPSRVFHQIGQWTIEGFANGIADAGPKLLKAMDDALDKTLDRVTSFRDGIKSRLDSVRSDFNSLRDGIASAFAGNIFDVSAITVAATELTPEITTSVSQAFMNGLSDTRGRLQGLLKAFKKLKHWGFSSQLLSQLFASGNSALILELASGPKSQAQADANLFSDVQSLSNQLGGQVARNQYGPQIQRLENRLDRANGHLKHLDTLAKDLAKALDHASATAHRRTA